MTDSIQNSTATSSEHSHTSSQSNNHTTTDIFRDYLRQFRAHGAINTIDGGDGDDLINSDQWHARIYGGDGNDTINATGHDVDVYGGSGDDVINVSGGHAHYLDHAHIDEHDHGPCSIGIAPVYFCSPCVPHIHMLVPALLQTSKAFGGEGNDTINADGFVYARGEGGDDIINMRGGNARGGEGDDEINSLDCSVMIFGESGDDKISSVGAMNINSYLSGGAGDDEIFASGSHLTLKGGTGNDRLTLDGTHDRGGVQNVMTGEYILAPSTLEGGIGDDTYALINDAVAVIEYFEGDGHDTLAGATEDSTLSLKGDITADNTTFSISGDDLVLTFGASDGSFTIKDYAKSGLPTVEFSDGRVMDASTLIAKAGGDPDAYSPDRSETSKSNADAETQD